MNRRLTALAFAAFALPMPALAQAWPAGAVVSVVSLRLPEATVPTLVLPQAPADGEATSEPAPRQAIPPAPRRLNLKSRTALDAEDAPPVELRAKSEWSDDTGLRASATKVFYKVRF